MIERISDKLIQLLKREDVISENDTDIYAYGLFQFMMMCLNVGTTILVGVLLKAFIPCVLLNISYIPLRVNAGGFHARTPLRCYLYSTVIIISLLLVLKYISISFVTSLSVLILSSVIVWLIAPVSTADDPFDDVEKAVFKRRTRIVLIAEIILYILCCFIHQSLMSNAIVLSVATETIMLLIGKAMILRNVE